MLWPILALVGCGASHPSGSRARAIRPQTPTVTTTTASRPAPAVRARAQPLIEILPDARRQGLFGWLPAVLVRGQTAVWISRVRAEGEPDFTITLLRFDQRLVALALHAGGSEPGGSGWRYGDAVEHAERGTVVAAFNSGFRENYGAGGFVEGARVGWPLRVGDASVVVYTNGTADIGAWQQGLPAAAEAVAAVRQNLKLLIDGGRIAPNVDSCIKVCWGDPLHEQPIVARSGLGVTGGAQLVWAAGHDLSVRALAQALAAAGAVRAMELDINPRWVAGYLYEHPPRGAAPRPIPLMPGQRGIPGEFLSPYFRDFFTVDVTGR